MTEKETLKLYNGEVEIIFYPNSHQYKIDGKNIISVSSACGIIDKSQPLIMWASKLAMDFFGDFIGKPLTLEQFKEGVYQHCKKKKEAASIGNAVHDYCEKYIYGIKDEYPEDEKVKNGIIGFLEWINTGNIKITESEKMVYSRNHNFVGTFDALAEVDGKTVLIDFKTSNNFYPLEMGMQTAGYQIALEEENNIKVDYRLIVRFDKETGEFETMEFHENKRDKEAFLAALLLKNLQKQLK